MVESDSFDLVRRVRLMLHLKIVAWGSCSVMADAARRNRPVDLVVLLMLRLSMLFLMVMSCCFSPLRRVVSLDKPKVRFPCLFDVLVAWSHEEVRNDVVEKTLFLLLNCVFLVSLHVFFRQVAGVFLR